MGRTALQGRPASPSEAPRRAAGQPVAALVNEAFAPAPTVAVLLLVVAWHSATSVTSALWWALLAVFFSSAIPFLYILSQVRRRRLTDRHVRERRQRPVPLLVAIASVLVGLVLLASLGAPRELVALVAAGAAGLVVCTAITFFWKLSIHAGVAAGTVVILVLVFGPVLLVLAPLVALVGWARVAVGAHRPAEVVAGGLVGAAVAATVFPLLR
jgi:membrane-associated phospholipid phosphatase